MFDNDSAAIDRKIDAVLASVAADAATATTTSHIGRCAESVDHRRASLSPRALVTAPAFSPQLSAASVTTTCIPRKEDQTHTETRLPPPLPLAPSNSFVDDSLRSLRSRSMSTAAMHNNGDVDEISRVGTVVQQGTLMGVSLWIALLVLVLRYAPAASWETPAGIEQQAHLIAWTLLLVTNVAKLLPLVFLRTDLVGFLQSGVTGASLAVQFMAMMSHWIMMTGPHPVLIDPITGLRFQLLQWVEWIPCCFVMSFLLDNVDLPVRPNNSPSSGRHVGTSTSSSSRPRWRLAIGLSISTAAGLVFPLCTTITAWWLTMCVSWLLFMLLPLHTYYQAHRYVAILRDEKSSTSHHPDHSAAMIAASVNHTSRSSAYDTELFALTRTAAVLSAVCLASWTLLAVVFTVAVVAPQLVHRYPNDSSENDSNILLSPHIVTIGNCVFEIVSKIWYHNILTDAYHQVFDESARAARRLEELRNFMSVVWDTSSDVIVFVTEQGKNHIQARISPAFMKLVGMTSLHSPTETDWQGAHSTRGLDLSTMAFLKEQGNVRSDMSPSIRHDVSLVLDIFPDMHNFVAYTIDLAIPVIRTETVRSAKGTVWTTKSSLTFQNVNFGDTDDKFEPEEECNPPDRPEVVNLKVMAQLVYQASRSASSSKQKDRTNVVNDFVKCPQKTESFEHSRDGHPERALRCESKVAQLENGSTTIVLRDISDRIKRFEAEKKVVRETTIRRKDAEANRFTRHEVKNGILAAVGLVDHLREMYETKNQLESTKLSSDCDHVDNDPAIQQVSDRPLAISAEYPLKRIVSFSDQQATYLAPTCGLESGTLMPEDDDTSEDRWACESSEASINSALAGTDFDELETTLRDTLDTILDDATAREIVYEEYMPRREKLNVPILLASIRRRSSDRFPLLASPQPFPFLMLDRQLLRHIYRNAISNACKYGKRDGVVKTTVTYIRSGCVFRMEVANEPGPGQEKLLQLDDETIMTIFNPATQLSVTLETQDQESETIRNESSGNGAWIMKKCAEVLGGTCSIRFENERTLFAFTCPANTAPNVEDNTSQGALTEEFRLPDNLWAFAVDDSIIQRKLLDRLLGVAGIPKERRIIVGATAEEVLGFAELVKRNMEEYPDDRFLVIADENLDIVEGGARQKTISGSSIIESMRRDLKPSTEMRLLALIRSANDSASDIGRYKSKAHGYMLKEPLKAGSALETIRPWWQERFPADVTIADDRFMQPVNYETEGSFAPSQEEIVESMDVIDALCNSQLQSVLAKRWPAIREKLHSLRGDLMTVQSIDPDSQLLRKIGKLRESMRLPKDFLLRWAEIRKECQSNFARFGQAH